MKPFIKNYLFVVLIMTALNVQAQQKKEEEKKEPRYEFTIEKEIPHTSIKSQSSSSTCWSFSATALFESEMMRTGKDSISISPMWTVRNIFVEKTIKYVRMHGKTSIEPGGSFYDVIYSSKKYGMIPESEYNGLNYGSTTHNHGEVDKVVENFGKSIITGRKLSTAWINALNGILDAYFGKAPQEFTYKGVKHTPLSFAESTGLNFDDYVSITSFTHHPFYTKFILEIPDNWIFESSYNLPLDEMMSVIENAIQNGYSVAWGADVSEKSFNRNIAVIPPEEVKKNAASEQTDRKIGKAQTKTESEPLPVEKTVTQSMRQEAFDNYETTDDHGMLMVGTAKDQNGNRFYKVKNSWGTENEYKGYLFVSEAYVKYKTMNIMVHKDAIPPEIRQKTGL